MFFMETVNLFHTALPKDYSRYYSNFNFFNNLLQSTNNTKYFKKQPNSLSWKSKKVNSIY